MKALVYQGPRSIAVEERPRPKLEQQSDAVVKMVKTTICGTDLHILKGDVPTCVPGRILGHEGIGVIEEVGNGVSQFKKGDRVIISCITSCCKCEYCKKGMYSHCASGGWILGHTIDGTQAEYVRIAYADTSLYHLPLQEDEEPYVMLSDILPTGFECGVINSSVKPGDALAIVGAGPVGLAALLTAQFYSPARIILIDLDDNRLAVARKLGATETVNGSSGNAVERTLALTDGRGVDCAIEAVGIPATFAIAEGIISAGGTVAVLGVFGVKVDFHLEKLWSHNITLRTRLVDTVTTPMLLKTIGARKLEPGLLITHHFKFAQILDAYHTFGKAAENQALKVIIEA
jgi:alcohol dehydrogenase